MSPFSENVGFLRTFESVDRDSDDESSSQRSDESIWPSTQCDEESDTDEDAWWQREARLSYEEDQWHLQYLIGCVEVVLILSRRR